MTYQVLTKAFIAEPILLITLSFATFIPYAGHPECVFLLLNAGLSPRLKDSFGQVWCAYVCDYNFG